MRRRHLVLVALGALLVALPVGSRAQTNLVTFETVTFAATAIGFTSTTIRPAGGPVMTTCSGKLETAQIRYRYDSTDPTASVGALLDVGDIISITGLSFLNDFRGIRTGATSGVIAWHCNRES